MRTWSELTEQERSDLEQRRLNGDFHRRRLIRFGYLSVPERRQLREKYWDLDDRFEPEDSGDGGTRYAARIFIVYFLGFVVGAGDIGQVSIFQGLLAVAVYCAIAAVALRDFHKTKDERYRLYPEWRND
jgi:hypothetical protein